MVKVSQRVVQCTVCQNKKTIIDTNELLNTLLNMNKVFCIKCLDLQPHIRVEKKRKDKV